jgi:hypothetical protein
LTPADGDPRRRSRAAGAGRYVRRSSLRAGLLALLALDAFLVGSLFIGVTTGGHRGVVFWLACIPLAALAGYFLWRTVRVWRLLRAL